MFRDCSIRNCPSDSSTLINGRQIKFYRYPACTKSTHFLWKNICKTLCSEEILEDKQNFRLCQLHFEKRFFDDNLVLKSEAIPSIFDHPHKRKLENVLYSPNKIKSLDIKKVTLNGPNSFIKETENPPMQNQVQSKKLRVSRTLNNSSKSPDKLEKSPAPPPPPPPPSTPASKSVRYRLVIDIDKIKPNSIKKRIKKPNEIQNNVAKTISNVGQLSWEIPVKKAKKNGAKNLRFSNQNITSNVSRDRFQYDSHQSRKSDPLKRSDHSYQKKEVTKSEYQILPDENIVTEAKEKKMKRKEPLNFIDKNMTEMKKQKLQEENLRFPIEENQEKIQEEEKEEEEKEEEGEGDYLRFSDENTTIEGNQEDEDLRFSDDTNHEELEEEHLNYSDDMTVENQEEEHLRFTDESRDRWQDEEREEGNLNLDKNVKADVNTDRIRPLDTSRQEKESTVPKNSSTNSNDKRCENGCALEKIICDENVSFRCLNCNNNYSVINKTEQEISNDKYFADRIIETGKNDSKVNLSEEDKLARKLLEHLIFTTGSICPCKGNCDLEKTLWNNEDAYKCKNCSNIYKKSVQKVFKSPFSDSDSINDDIPSDFFDDSNDCEESDNQSSDFWNQGFLSDSSDTKSNVSLKNLKKKANHNKEDVSSDTEAQKYSKSVFYIPESSGCENGCQLVETYWNDTLAYECTQCKNVYVPENNDQVMTNESEVKGGNDKLKNIIDRFKSPSDKLKKTNDLLKILDDQLKRTQDKLKTDISKIPNDKIKKALNLLKASKKKFKLDEKKFKRDNKTKTMINKAKANDLLKTNEKLKTTEDKLKKNNRTKKTNDIIEDSEIIDLVDETLECKTCNKFFPSSDMLFDHVKEHLTCDICYCVFSTQLEFKSHMILHTTSNENNPFQCHICDFPFKTKDLVKEHLDKVHGIKPPAKHPQVMFVKTYQCIICEAVFMGEVTLRNHVNLLHKNVMGQTRSKIFKKSMKFSCKVCEMEFPTLKEIKGHTMMHLNQEVKELKCNICKKIFRNNQLFQNHLREHIARSYQCNKCLKSFIDESSLKAHMASHELYYIIQH